MGSLAISSTMPNSPLDRLPRPLAVAIHDAGAANMIAAWAAATSRLPDRVLAAGPARATWKRRFGQSAAIHDDPEALDTMACVVTGTGWASDFEHRARIAAARANLRSVAVVDHWVNYQRRFERDARVQMPDTIWVGDEDARRIACEAFPKHRIEQHPNLYLEEQASQAGPVPEDGDILFVMEPARNDWGRGEPGEFQALAYLLANAAIVGVSPRAPIRVRPHPSDPQGKSGAWLSQNPRARLDTSPDMASALNSARWGVGLHSAGLVIALAAGREVISALPPWGPPCLLPHKGIIKLADAVSAQTSHHLATQLSP